MRHFNKSKTIPATLQKAPIPTSASQVDPAIYKASDVKEQLLKDQAYKCAYCEKKVEGAYDDVEHYRPKNQYHWLGHDWKNLLFACTICNRSYKKTNFPLADETKRSIDTHDISKEEPLIINPSTESPSNYIVYNQHIMQPRIINGQESLKGKYTIELFKLNDRKVIVEERRALYESFNSTVEKRYIAEQLLLKTGLPDEVYAYAQQLITSCNSDIIRMQSPETPYSGMLLSNHP